METEGEAVARLERLKARGTRVHIDDFGTGYSSLSYLHRLPVDALKIDRSFIGHMEEAGDAVVRSVLDLGENLGLSVIAEGVETAAQLDRLRALGCRLAQGIHLAAPADADAIGELLQRGLTVPALAAPTTPRG
jgi:EAL domain-containing protein (putative c-di-GMP-specific phosphodiesterase class I)